MSSFEFNACYRVGRLFLCNAKSTTTYVRTVTPAIKGKNGVFVEINRYPYFVNINSLQNLI